jgi:uncharacterized membrane protein
MTAFVLPLVIGLVAGLRSMTAPAAVSLASRAGWLDVGSTPLAFFGYTFTPWVFTALALGELVIDQLPTTPSRTEPMPFGTRIVVGALCGGAIGASGGALVSGLVAGIAGATIGTLGGHALRARLAAAFGRDRPAALIEDAVAIGGALLVVVALP